jgi:hypothetical protein
MTKEARPKPAAAEHDEDLIDEALDESFPASDPISPAVGHGQPHDDDVPSTPSKSAWKAAP